MASNTADGRRLADGGQWYSEPYIVNLGEEFSNVGAQVKFRTNDYEGTGSSNADPVELLGLGQKGEMDASLAENMLKNPYYQDTRVGGNDAINCLWQFNRDDDIVHPVNETMKGGTKYERLGMGRVYAATTQFNQQICWFTFGIPYFTKLGRFYQTAFDPDLIGLNNNAIAAPGVELGRIFGTVGSLFFALAVIPTLFGIFSRIGRAAKKYPVNRFYELRSTMQLYYDYVDSILAHWLVSAGLYNNGPAKNKTGADYVPDALTYTGANIWDILRRKAQIVAIHSTSLSSSLTAYNGIYSEDDDHSAYYEERDNSYHQIPSMYGQGTAGVDTPAGTSMNEEGDYEFANAFEIDADGGTGNTGDESVEDKITQKMRDADYMRQIQENLYSVTQEGGDTTGDTVKDAVMLGDDYISKFTNQSNQSIFSANLKDWTSTFWNSALGASEFIGFRITNSTDASESFSNSTQESEFARAFNEKVSSAMRVRNDLGYGSGKNQDSSDSKGIIDKALGWIGGVINGAIDAFNAIDVLGITDVGQALMQGSWVDIPEQYSGSDFNKSHSLTLQLRSPYGDPVSIYQSIIVPLACLLAGTLPRGSGENSYTQPFLCRIYCKGMFAVPMGIIDSLSIKRGESEFGWTYDNIPLCIDVSVSIKDMSPIMYLSMNTNTFAEIFNNDSSFNEYLRTLSGVGLFERVSEFSKFKRALQYTAHRLRNKVFNPAYASFRASQWNVFQGIAAIIPRTAISRR